ncbi:MAG: (d)CMP kinase [Verrucomicrobiales bacterium]
MAEGMMNHQHSVIAIDGPAASGKSSVSRRLSSRLGYLHVNSGIMYRALTWSVLNSSIQTEDTEAVVAHLGGLDICCGISGEEATLTVDGIDPGSGLKSSEVNAEVSAISKIPDVRDVLVAKQREYLDVADIVMEGRDIGSVVFPETPYKFYIDASAEIRTRRRMDEGIEDNLAERDAVDSGRATSPLVIAEDAVVIDTSEMTLEKVLIEVIDRLRVQGLDILN